MRDDRVLVREWSVSVREGERGGEGEREKGNVCRMCVRV